MGRSGSVVRTCHDEIFFLLQNLMLMGQAMGMGVWGHGSIWPAFVLQRIPENGWYGLGFRHMQPRPGAPWSPTPASQHNPVGIDGLLEGLCPPYVSSMDEAVDRVIEKKHGPHGIFTCRCRDISEAAESTPARSDPLREGHLQLHLRDLRPVSGAFRCILHAGFWVQFHHLELEYYERFFDPYLWRNQAAHNGRWHQSG